jgi:predicted nucleic acid-binding protein
VLDSYAVLAYLFGEPGDSVVAEALEKAATSSRKAVIAAPNWAEVCYQVESRIGPRRWASTREKLLALPIEIVPADQGAAESAGAIKASKRMSLADCFAAALAAKIKGELLTGDPEFREVEDMIKIVWLGPKARG